MKRILLTSTALVAFAGAAAAEVTFGGDAELGYNDDFSGGIFWSFGLTVNGSMELDNGLKASISGDVELVNAPEVDDQGTFDPSDDVVINGSGSSAFDGNDVQIDDLVISLSSDNASLTFGDTAPAADALYSSAVTNIDADGFNDEGDLNDASGNSIEDGVLIGRVKFGASEVGVSYAVANSNDASIDDDLEMLQVGANTTLGNFDISFGYQEAVQGFSGNVGGVSTPNSPEIYALSASTTFGGAKVGLAYAKSSGTNAAGGAVSLTSIGVQAAYTFDAITATVFYSTNDLKGGTGTWDDNYGIALDYASGPLTVGFLYHDGEDEDMQLNVAYDMGNGLSLFGGYRDEGENGADVQQGKYTYIGGDYDLGGGAAVRVSYADVDAGPGGVATARDELGKSEDVKEGVTVSVKFKF